MAKFPIPSFSQSGEDRLVLKLFGYRASGVYVDVGCHDPVRLSNTCLLYSAGWRGLVVDADKDVLSRFSEVRSEDRVVHSGVGRAGKKRFFVFEDRALNTFDEDVVNSWKGNNNFPVDAYEVEISPLAKILEKKGVKDIDFLNIDVEGMDLEALQSNDWSKWQPAVVAVEDHELDLETPSNSTIFTFMKDCGYYLVSKILYSSFYARKPIHHAVL